MDTKGEGKQDTIAATCYISNRLNNQAPVCAVPGSSRIWGVGALILPLFTLFEAHESILTLTTFHKADNNSNFQPILVKEKQNQNGRVLCAKT